MSIVTSKFFKKILCLWPKEERPQAVKPVGVPIVSKSAGFFMSCVDKKDAALRVQARPANQRSGCGRKGGAMRHKVFGVSPQADAEHVVSAICDDVVDSKGFEPSTSAMRTQRSPN